MSNHQRKFAFVDERVNVPSDIVSKARDGDATAQLTMGKIYVDATYVENNRRIAFDWMTLSANQGNMEAQFKLGDLYILGHGTSKCFSDAYQWYTKAAIQGYKKALTRLHNLYQEDVKIHCRGQINLKELGERPIFDESQIDDRKMISNFAIVYYTDQFKHYQSSKHDDFVVQINLAFLYQHGYGAKKCIRWAFEYYTKAAEQGSTDAQYNLGHLYQKHTNIKFNYRQAFKWFTRSAQGGNIAAQRSLAYFYLKGLAGDIDYELALFWYNKAAEAGDSEAQMTLGKLYRKGDCVKQDLPMAVKWYSLAAQQGNIVAQNCLSQLHQRGILNNITLEQDILEYVTEDSMKTKWFTWAADQGNSDAQYNLGMLSLYGIGLREDKEEAIQWFFKSTDQKNIQACSTVGDIYLHGRYGVERSAKRGLKLLEFAAKNGSVYAQTYLGSYYSNTKTEHHDLSKSILYYTMAVDSGNITASYDLAMIYLDVNDTPEDYIKIYSLFKQSGAREVLETPMSISASIKDYSGILNMFIEVTNSGIDDLHYRIGNLYENGVQRYGKFIFDPDYTNAIKWYAITSIKGDSRADYRLGVMHECGKYFKRDTATAMTYYNKASINGNTDAIYRLACIYANGYGVTQDLLRAFQLFARASTMGHKNANKQFKVERVYESDDLNHSYYLTPDPEIAVNKKTRIYMLEKAIEEGYVRLEYQLGIMYEKDQDSQGAFKWFSPAADIGVTDAYYRLGVFYEEGRGVDQDYVMAEKMYQKAVEKEHEDACYRLGQLYQYGNGVELDYLKAYQFYKKASDMGHVEAHKILNITLKSRIMSNMDIEKNSIDPSSQEYQNSILMSKCVAEHGNTEVQFQVGFAYEHNVSGPNYDEAHKWYSMAAESSHKEAIYHLGLLYEKGLGVSQDYQKANELYERVKQQNSDDALYKLGTLYHYGKGVEADPEKAIDYYKHAAEQGNPKYQSKLGRLYEDGELVEKNLLEALKWYTKAYLQGYNDVRQRLYDMYEHELYEDYFFKRLLQNLLVASCGHFRLKNFYPSDVFCDVNSRIGAIYFFGQGTGKDLRKGWEYLSKEYDGVLDIATTSFLFLGSNSIDSIQKSYILNTIEETVTLINQMNKQQLYVLGQHFFEGVVETRDSYTTLGYYDYDNYGQHIITEKNYTKAFNCLKKAADKGYPPAIHQLGIMYHCGYGVDKDIEQGENHFNEVVNNVPEYMKSISILYHTHDGMQDFAKALQWYKRLEKRLDEDLTDSEREKINELVQVGLGLLYEYGGGVEQDYQKALGCYKGLVDNNAVVGFHRLGLIYYYGKGVLVDYKEALSLFEKATHDRNHWNYKLPFVYPQTGGHTDDTQSNLIFCTIALLETKGESYYYLGMMHKNGQGVPQDEERAQGYFREALYHLCERAKYEVVH